MRWLEGGGEESVDKCSVEIVLGEGVERSRDESCLVPFGDSSMEPFTRLEDVLFSIALTRKWEALLGLPDCDGERCFWSSEFKAKLIARGDIIPSIP